MVNYQQIDKPLESDVLQFFYFSHNHLLPQVLQCSHCQHAAKQKQREDVRV